MGYTDKEVGRMTFKRLMQMYGHYKTNYDFKIKGITYAQLDEYVEHQGEFLPD